MGRAVTEYVIHSAYGRLTGIATTLILGGPDKSLHAARNTAGVFYKKKNYVLCYAQFLHYH